MHGPVFIPMPMSPPVYGGNPAINLRMAELNYEMAHNYFVYSIVMLCLYGFQFYVAVFGAVWMSFPCDASPKDRKRGFWCSALWPVYLPCAAARWLYRKVRRTHA